MSEPNQQIYADRGAQIQGILQVAGDYYQIFASAAPGLKRVIRSQEFGVLFTERIRSMVGREYLFDRVSQKLSPEVSRSGYIVIRGQPGIGKTTFMCMLLQRWACVHHFNIVQQNLRSTRAFLENVSAQVIVKYGLNYEVLPDDTDRDSAFFGQVLREAASKSQEPVVVLIDALDEAEDAPSPGANRLFLPPVLPDRVHIVLTTREQIDYRLEVDQRQDVHIEHDDPENMADVGKYVESVVANASERFTRVLADWKLNSLKFVELLVDRSQGNFMYMVQVLADIRDGRITAENLGCVDDLPQGLRAYYQRHWRQMRGVDREKFELLYEPALRLLASAREPVSLDLLSSWSGASLAGVREVISAWRQFLTESQVDGERRYSIYHESFREFLAQEGGGLQPSHARITQTALDKIFRPS